MDSLTGMTYQKAYYEQLEQVETLRSRITELEAQNALLLAVAESVRNYEWNSYNTNFALDAARKGGAIK